MSPQIPALPPHMPAIPQAYLQPGLTIRQLHTIFLAYRRRSVQILLSLIAAAALVALFLPRTYTATATLMVDFDVNDPLSGKEFPNNLMSNYLATQRDLIQSPAVLLPAVAAAKLTSDPHYYAGYRQGSGDISVWVMEKLQKNLKVDVGTQGSQLIYVSYSGSSAKEAANIANIIAHTYADQQFRRVNDPASESAQRYAAKLEELKQGVDNAQAKVTEFRQRTGSVEFDSKDDPGAQRLADLEHRLLDAQESRRALETRASVNSAEQSSALASPTVQTLKSTLATQEARLAELRQTLGPNHPEIWQLQSEMAATQSSLNAELGTYARSARSDYEGAAKLESQLQTAVDQERTRVLQARKLQDDGATYLQALDAAKTLYQRALDGYDQVLLASSGRYSNVKFVAEATPPIDSNTAKLLLIILIAAVVSAIPALLGPLLYELTHRRVRCRDDLERELGLPVLLEFGRPAFKGALS